MINFVSTNQLYEDTFQRSSLISVPQMASMLEVPNSAYSKWQIFSRIIKDALKEYEKYIPLRIVQRMYISVDSITRKAYLADNFKAYMEGVIDESQITLLPSAISGLSISHYTASTYPMRNFRYQPPVISDCWYASGVYFVHSTCKRPYFEEYDKASGKPTERSGIYYMTYNADSNYSIFYDEVYRCLCRYLLNIKKNMTYPNAPIELFGGLEEDYQQLNTSLDTIYQQSIPDEYSVI